MAGIYLHIPFCKQACYYCNFHFSTSLAGKPALVAGILKEIELQQDYLDGEKIETIYFGGGTPSLLTHSELSVILEKLSLNFDIAPGAEITLEANPDDIVPEKLSAWNQAGINRLSIGVQSFFEVDLLWMNRAHNADQALRSIREAQDAGFRNMSIDLIYGSPTTPDENWKENVAQAIALDIPHLSCYALTIEPKTALQKMIRQEKVADVNPDQQARQFSQLMKWMENAGYEHYEISNFAKPGKRSRHNSSYWQGKKYLGIGPSAHSYNGDARQWNIANNAEYLKAIRNDQLLFEEEILQPVQKLNEYIMIALRTSEGIDIDRVGKEFGMPAVALLMLSAQKHIQLDQLERHDSKLRLTTEGKFLADGIASALFFETV